MIKEYIKWVEVLETGLAMQVMQTPYSTTMISGKYWPERVLCTTQKIVAIDVGMELNILP